MSKATQHKNTTPRVRQNANRRSNQQKVGCKKCVRTKESCDKVIADSIYSLTAKSIIGFERFLKVETSIKDKVRGEWSDNYGQMLNDLNECANNAICVMTGYRPTFNPLKSGLSIELAFTYVINLFENNVLPKGFDYNIDYDEEAKEYYFTVYKELQGNGGWMAFEIKPIVKKLERVRDDRLWEIFMNFLRSFIGKTGIGLWCDCYGGHAEYALDEEINNLEDDFDDEDSYYSRKYAMQQCVQRYKKGGEVYRIQQIIFKAETKTADALIEDLDYYLNLKLYRKNKAIAYWLKEACEFMKLNGCINDFIYDELFRNYYNEEGVRLEDQYTIIWDSQDEYTEFLEQILDSMAQGCGVVSPFINYPIKKDTKHIDWIEFEERSKWIDKITPLWKSYDKLLDTLKPKKRNASK